MVRVIHDWRSGKQTAEGVPIPTAPETVTVVSKDNAIDTFGCRDRRELVAWLQSLRARGLLITPKHGLLQSVRTGSRDERGYAVKESMYVVRGEGVPMKRQHRNRIMEW